MTASRLCLRPMEREDIEEVMRIEHGIYHYPWTAGNFIDSLNFRYVCRVAELDGAMIGYAVLMPALDEAHLLNIGIAAAHQCKGIGSDLLERMMAIARESGMRRVLLEVRPSNVAALALYRKGGFREIGLRRGYYPADNGREDAIVMERIV
jgi:[ribosomal protein S18]-alanine N-acetyltransferase